MKVLISLKYLVRKGRKKEFEIIPHLYLQMEYAPVKYSKEINIITKTRKNTKNEKKKKQRMTTNNRLAVSISMRKAFFQQ